MRETCFNILWAGGKDPVRMENLVTQETEMSKHCSRIAKRGWIWPLLETLTVNIVIIMCIETFVVGQIRQSSLLIVAVFSKRSEIIS